MQFYVFLACICSVFSYIAAQCPNGWQQSTVQTNKCYMIVTTKKNWFAAELQCKTALPGAHLASICSAFENANIEAIVYGTSDGIARTQQLWIGLNDIDANGKFLFVDGNTCPYRKWGHGQPSIHPNTECVSFAANSSGQWFTRNCGTEYYSICEYLSSSSSLPPTTTGAITSMSTSSPAIDAQDCYELYHAHGIRKSGIYWIRPPGFHLIQAYCEMEVDGGGWTVFQRRIDDTLSFYDKTWKEYKNGFNNGLNKNLWLGNDAIHFLSTKDSNVSLRIDMWGDRAPNSGDPDIYFWQQYTSFRIDNETNGYLLRISNTATGNASDPDSSSTGLNYNNYNKFSTIDFTLNDGCDGCCYQRGYQLGGWWLDFCTETSLNGKYVPPVWQDTQGFEWFYGPNSAGPDFIYNPAQSRMMLRKISS